MGIAVGFCFAVGLCRPFAAYGWNEMESNKAKEVVNDEIDVGLPFFCGLMAAAAAMLRKRKRTQPNNIN